MSILFLSYHQCSYVISSQNKFIAIIGGIYIKVYHWENMFMNASDFTVKVINLNKQEYVCIRFVGTRKQQIKYARQQFKNNINGGY